uniref:Ig-like domain-containing protein n=1 Tax=Mastacembelus armatus TaxID=205130 RepID=A0A3Q3KP71_9TELE
MTLYHCGSLLVEEPNSSLTVSTRDFCFEQHRTFMTLSNIKSESDQLQQGSATLVCVASGGFPSAWSLGWKVGGSSSSSGVSSSPEVLGMDGRYSWSSTLSLTPDQWRKAGSVACEASLSGQSPVTKTLNPDSCLN